MLGTVSPVTDWTALAHQQGSTVLVDAARQPPTKRWMFKRDADFVVFSGHKVCGPTGIGVLYGRETLLESTPPFLGGGGMINRVTTEGFTAAELPKSLKRALLPSQKPLVGSGSQIHPFDRARRDRATRTDTCPSR